MPQRCAGAADSAPLCFASGNRDAAERGWVGDDLGLDAKRVPGMNAESTAHCLRAEMPALCHVGLLAQRDNPFGAAPGEEGKEGRQDLSVPQHSSQRIP